jgi:hypothetical protein
MIRAKVNWMAASILILIRVPQIASHSHLCYTCDGKLWDPLADRAWDRESAVYRYHVGVLPLSEDGFLLLLLLSHLPLSLLYSK